MTAENSRPVKSNYCVGFLILGVFLYYYFFIVWTFLHLFMWNVPLKCENNKQILYQFSARIPK